MRLTKKTLMLAGLLALGACDDDPEIISDTRPLPVDAGPEDAGSEDASPGSDSAVDGGVDHCADLAGVVDEDTLRSRIGDLATIAADHGGNRASGRSGYAASAAYVREALAGTGLVVTESEPFDFPYFEVLESDVLETVSPDRSYDFDVDNDGTEADFIVMGNSYSGDVTGQIQPVDLALDAPADSTSGCEVEDFAGFTAGRIALVQRGACSFYDKVANAQGAGAVGVVVFNQGTEGRTGLDFVAILADEAVHDVDLPVVFTTYAVGTELAALGETSSVRLATDHVFETRTTTNVYAETAFGDDSDVLMVGAHLDSVVYGPGLNDNGSGSVALLEIARAVGRCEGARRVRFAWWGAEETGLIGSDVYVAGLTDEERSAVVAYLNFDMLASPNHGHFTYSGEATNWGSEEEEPAPIPGSVALEAYFRTDFEARALPIEETEELLFRSDHTAFDLAGIPTGGLFTGADAIKTPEEQTLFGGTAGLPFDSCYHLACDDADNVDYPVFVDMAVSVANAIEHFGLAGMPVVSERTSQRAPLEELSNRRHAAHPGCAAGRSGE